MAVLDDVATRLRAAAVVEGATGWELALSFEPATPDKLVIVTETGGREPHPDFRYLSFQVRVRGAQFGYATAKTQIEAVRDALHNQTVGSGIYCYARSDVLMTGYDGNERPVLSLNFETMVAE